MKAGKEHHAPLSPRAVEIIKEPKGVKPREFVFPGQKPGPHLSKICLPKLLRRFGFSVNEEKSQSTAGNISGLDIGELAQVARRMFWSIRSEV